MTLKMNAVTGISYEVIGNRESKDTLLFLHGAGGNKKALMALAAQFEQYHCVLVDLPGHYLSKGAAPENVSGYAVELERFIISLGSELGEHITCIGHSMGGMVSLELALRRIPQIEKLVILNSGAKLDLNKDFMRKIEKGKVDKLYLFKAGGSYFNIRTYQFFLKSFKEMIASEKVMREDMKMVSRFDQRKAVHNINLPTLIMTGEKEILATVQDSEYLHSQISGSQLVIIKGLSHLMPVVAPEKLAKRIEIFLNAYYLPNQAKDLR